MASGKLQMPIISSILNLEVLFKYQIKEKWFANNFKNKTNIKFKINFGTHLPE